VPYTPQQNGVAERKNRSLTEMAQCMVKSQALPHSFWLEAIMCATYVLNRCPTKALQSMTPYEAWHDRKPSIESICMFFVVCHMLWCHKHNAKNWMIRLSNVFLLVIVLKANVTGCIIRPQTKRILVSRDVVFVEDSIQPLLSCTRDNNVSSQDQRMLGISCVDCMT